MKMYFEGYPFSPRSGKILEETATYRIERYYRESDFRGDFFDIRFDINDDGLDVSFSITTFSKL